MSAACAGAAISAPAVARRQHPPPMRPSRRCCRATTCATELQEIDRHGRRCRARGGARRTALGAEVHLQRRATYGEERGGGPAASWRWASGPFHAFLRRAAADGVEYNGHAIDTSPRATHGRLPLADQILVQDRRHRHLHSTPPTPTRRHPQHRLRGWGRAATWQEGVRLAPRPAPRPRHLPAGRLPGGHTRRRADGPHPGRRPGGSAVLCGTMAVAREGRRPLRPGGAAESPVADGAVHPDVHRPRPPSVNHAELARRLDGRHASARAGA